MTLYDSNRSKKNGKAPTRVSDAPQNIGRTPGSSQPLILYVNSYPLISQPPLTPSLAMPLLQTRICPPHSEPPRALFPHRASSLTASCASPPPRRTPSMAVQRPSPAAPYSTSPVVGRASPGHNQPDATSRRSSPDGHRLLRPAKDTMARRKVLQQRCTLGHYSWHPPNPSSLATAVPHLIGHGRRQCCV
jgi:hypothetical protein